MRGSAPGRLDLLGGVADYSGALVLEMPTRSATAVTAWTDDALVVGPAALSTIEVQGLAELAYEDLRGALAALPVWTHYVIGVAVVLVRHGVIEPPRARLEISSDLPPSVGVASSAALEVATARALGAGGLDPLRLAALCQEAENHVVGAPCGIMDQVAVTLGTAGAVLPILCRPASAAAAVPVPAGLEIVGWPTGAPHDVGGPPYARARAAAFMGRRMVEEAAGGTWPWVSQLPQAAVDELPDTLDGATFLERWGGTGDDVTTVEAGEAYPVRAADVVRRGGARAQCGRAGLAAGGGARSAWDRCCGPATPATTPWAWATRRRRPSWRRRSPGRACTAPARAGAAAGARSSSCAGAGALDDVDGLIR